MLVVGGVLFYFFQGPPPETTGKDGKARPRPERPERASRPESTGPAVPALLETDAQSQAVIDGWVLANGGAEKLAELRTLQRRGTLEIDRRTYALELVWSREGRFRLDVRQGTGARQVQTAYGYDRAALWQQTVRPNLGQPLTPDWREVEPWTLAGALPFRLLDHKALGYAFGYDGLMRLGRSGQAHQLRVHFAGLVIGHVMFDEKSLLIPQISYQVRTDGELAEVQRHVRKLEQFEGFWMETEAEDLRDGAPVGKWVWTETLINPILPPAAFAPAT